MAVFNSRYLFDPIQIPVDVLGVGFIRSLVFQPYLIASFLAASAVCLLISAAYARKAPEVIQSHAVSIFASVLCAGGVACIWLEGSWGIVAIVLAGILMGIGSSIFLIRWGGAFANFRFVTAVINSGLSFALSLIISIAFINWVPAPATGLIAICLPFTFLAIFWNRDDLGGDAQRSRIPASNIVSYYVRLVISLLVLGVCLGAMRVFCASELLSAEGITIELVMGAGSITAAVLFIVALALSKKEMQWDWLFRVGIPVIAFGCACLPFLIGDMAYASAFFLSLAYIFLEVLLWVLLTSIANDINGTFVFGLGIGALNLASILGIVIAGWAIDVSILENGIRTAGLMQYSFALLALMLTVLTIVGYSLLPRYYELKMILSSVLSEMAFEPSHVSGTIKAQLNDPVDSRTSVTQDLKSESEPEPIIKSQDQPIVTDSPVAVDDPVKANNSAITDNNPAITNDTPPSEEVEQRDPKGSFTRRCEELAGNHSLSARETEVFFLLAKGHNAAYITEQLCISRATAKTHINHIYKKLDVHTQQELLNMVEDRKRHANTVDERPLAVAATTGAMGAAVPQDPEKLKEVVLQAHIKQHNH